MVIKVSIMDRYIKDTVPSKLTRRYPRMLLLAQGHGRGLQIVPRRWEQVRRLCGTCPSVQSLKPVRLGHSCPVYGAEQAWQTY